ncbi:zinc-binding dehydrogenase [Antribacter sp. KLBMP9083]|uniref:Zinc-binding dehydrogenase n=1 Tax=Antribacter soli TaxID=2910976 RepID=A0AA41QK46_9MICO|nr:zinc-binding dehydrogenase [Antribacter soli]MCF4123747.1 zinc-binding dehydrogenase [Antribacter soli]
MFQTAYGSLTTGLDLRAGQTLLIRGGTSTVGLSAAATMAKDIGATVISTTRHADRKDELRAIGVDHPIVDDGTIPQQVRNLAPGGVDAALELVGCTVLPDTLGCVRRHGTVCFTGALAGGWTIPEFSPFIPGGVRLTSYAGDATDLPSHVFQEQLHAIADGRLTTPIAKTYHSLDRVRDAQAGLEAAATPGKHIVLLDDQDGPQRRHLARCRYGAQGQAPHDDRRPVWRGNRHAHRPTAGRRWPAYRRASTDRRPHRPRIPPRPPGPHAVAVTTHSGPPLAPTGPAGSIRAVQRRRRCGRSDPRRSAGRGGQRRRRLERKQLPSPAALRPGTSRVESSRGLATLEHRVKSLAGGPVWSAPLGKNSTSCWYDSMVC